MKETYLEVTYRHGRPLAAYLYLPRQEGDVSVRTRKVAPGIVVDYADDDRPIGIEITSPRQVSAEALNSVLADLDLSPMEPADLAPMCAA
jgi:hypothetical protein